jgi:hypothetical protein
MVGQRIPSDKEMAAQLFELQQTIPDVPLDELTIEQLEKLQRATANLAAWTEQKSGDVPQTY